jgi:hypothetical protein
MQDCLSRCVYWLNYSQGEGLVTATLAEHAIKEIIKRQGLDEDTPLLEKSEPRCKV